jgi:hypothetical protein
MSGSQVALISDAPAVDRDDAISSDSREKAQAFEPYSEPIASPLTATRTEYKNRRSRNHQYHSIFPDFCKLCFIHSNLTFFAEKLVPPFENGKS